MSDASYTNNDFLELKGKWPLLSYLLFFWPHWRFVGVGNERLAACPWDASCDVLLDLQTNSYHVFRGTLEVGKGDVIDLESRRLKVDRATAAARLNAYQVQVPSWH